MHPGQGQTNVKKCSFVDAPCQPPPESGGTYFNGVGKGLLTSDKPQRVGDCGAAWIERTDVSRGGTPTGKEGGRLSDCGQGPTKWIAFHF
eukprot:366569-Chlamydomonas_euryale.AAC.34